MEFLAERHVHKHHAVVGGTVIDPFPIPAPPGLAAAVRGDLQLAIGHGERDHVHLKFSGLVLVRRVGEPLPILRKLRLVFLEVSFHDGKRLAGFVILERQCVDILISVLAKLERNVLAVARPILGRFVRCRRQEWPLRAGPVRCLLGCLALAESALTALWWHRPVVVLAPPSSTVRRATRIVVLEEGEITDIGPHDELVKRAGTYQRLYNLQFMDSAEQEKVAG